MGIVGEQGAEMIFMPQGTQVVPADRTTKYKQAIDAMIDNRFEDYVYKTMIAPALMEASKKMEKERQKSFAENIAQSFAPKDGLSYYDLVEALGKGTSIKNGDAIGKAIAKHLNPGYSNQRYN